MALDDVYTHILLKAHLSKANRVYTDVKQREAKARANMKK